MWLIPVVVVLAAVLLLVLRARAARARLEAWRQEVAAGYRTWLAEHRPDLPFDSEDHASQELLWEAAEGVSAGDLPALYRAFAGVRARGLAPFPEPLQLKVHLQRVLPLLIPAHLVAALPRAVVTPLPDLRLAVLYTVEGAFPGAYLTLAQVEEHGLDPAAVHGVSLAVLRQRFDGAVVQEVLATGEPRTLSTDDPTTASRLLLIPEHLPPGTSLTARIPHPTTLHLAPFPPGFGSGSSADLPSLTSTLFEVSLEGLTLARPFDPREN